MNAAVDFPDAQYAVIEVLQTETAHENIVIAYSNEKTLREAFAASSIVAFGFATRDEAIGTGTSAFATADAGTPPREKVAATETSKPAQKTDRAQTRDDKGSLLPGLARLLGTSWCGAVTSGVLMIASTNRVLSAIRMALGSSV